MIVCGYDLHLYCENHESEPDKHTWVQWPDVFGGGTKAEAFRDARAKGWRINERENKAYCPNCKRKR